MKKFTLGFLVLMCFAFLPTQAHAVIYNWTDWKSSSATNGFTALGTLTTLTSTVDVTYNNPQGIAFFQDGVGFETDWWAQGGSGSLGRIPATSPFTSDIVDNIPTGTDMIGLRFAGPQTLSFSATIANPIFSYISLNANGYAFDQDFDILSVGGVDGNDCGWWGCGTSSKAIVETSPGVFEYQLVGTGEPHGTIRFKGAFDTVSWRSLTAENWNGFTVGVEGTAEEIFPDTDTNAIPEPASMLLFATGLAGAAIRRKFSV